ncbi:MAG: GNAT family N-acetyltransferase [Pseudomonadota bacterium]
MNTTLKPGEEIGYTVTFLEMTERPTWPTPSLPVGQKSALVAASNPPVEYFLYLYSAVGAPHEWTDWLQKPREELEAFVGNPQVLLYTLMVDGWPGGFFVLDRTGSPATDLANFGLVPEAIGRGLGRWLLATAILTAWSDPATERLTVNTNTLDHPRALGLYQRMGFQVVRQEDHRRILTRERPIPG